MKTYLSEFLRRGFLACWGGPVILAVIYGILGLCGAVVSLEPIEVCKGILTITLLAFVAGGITMVYQIERLPTFFAALIHGGVLYADYLIIYLVNGWLADGWMPVVIFTVAFLLGYAVIWLCIYCCTIRNTGRLNAKLQK